MSKSQGVLYSWLTIFVIVAMSWPHPSDAAPSRRASTLKAAKRTTRGKSVYHFQRQKLDPTYQKFEVRTAPIAILAKWYTLDMSYRFTERFAAGPTAIWYNARPIGNMFMPSYRGYAAGAQATYYLSSVAVSGWYLGARGYYEDYTSYPHSGYTRKIEGLRGDLMLGYQEKLQSISMLIGIGPEIKNHLVTETSRQETGSYSATSNFDDLQEIQETKVGLMIEFKMGFEF